MTHRLIIADDHEVVRQGLRDLFAPTDLEIVAEARDGLEAERLARTLAADLLILDIAMPARRGLQILESLRADGIGLPVLFFSMYPAEQYLDYARRAGAQGFVGKDASTGDLLRAARQILRGSASFSRRRGLPPLQGETRADPFAALSPREYEVMRDLLAGVSLIEIASRLGVSPKTVTTYRRRLLEKLGLKSNAELVALAAREGQL